MPKKIEKIKKSKIKTNTKKEKVIDSAVNIFDEIEKIVIKDKRFVKYYNF